MNRTSGLLLSTVLVGLSVVANADEARRPLSSADLFSMRAVSDVQFSPDGDSVAFTVATVNEAEDSREWSVWILDWSSGKSREISAQHPSAFFARWSKNGQYLAFLSGGPEQGTASQLWLYRPKTGELQQVTEITNGVTDFDWAPDAKHLVLVVEGGSNDSQSWDRAAPIVIDRFRFKRDGVGYLGDSRNHLQIVELASGALTPLTDGLYDEIFPAWSPDGSRIAFVSKRGADPDRHQNWDVYTIDPTAVVDDGVAANSTPLTQTGYAESNPEGWGGRPVWSPDSKHLVYTIDREPNLSYYSLAQLGAVSVTEESDRILTAELDRNAMSPQWSADGSAVYFLVEDEMGVHVATVPADGGKPSRLTGDAVTVRSFDVSESGQIVVVYGSADQPYEIGKVDNGSVRRLSEQNDGWLENIRLGTAETFEVSSPDGTQIRGLMVKPPGFEQGRRYPTILRIHGGPVGQFRKEFNFEWQLFAANGYVVLGVNPRGSSGRGEAFQLAIKGNLGHGDVPDVLAAIDYVVDEGIADPDRLGIGGWSYGAMLTNYTIASDPRFKAATSGAGVSNMLAVYGSDEWVQHWELELGQPWENPENWLRLSYPFLKANKISTPTLFLCGALDINVPAAHSEQMYQALRSLGVDSTLIIYPDEYHQISRPSFRRDMLDRYLGWYQKYLLY